MGPDAGQSIEVTELTRKIGSIDVDITLVNKRLEESQGMCSASFIILYRKMREWHNVNALCMHCRWCAEALSAELPQAKEQARASNAADLKAAEELRAQ